MAVSYGPGDVIGLAEYGPEFLIPLHAKQDRLGDVTRQVVLLRRECGRNLVEKFHPFPSYPYPFDPTRYHASAWIEFDSDDPRDIPKVRNWLLNLPIHVDEEIYLYWKTMDWRQKGCPALVTTWGAFAQSLWNVVWNPFDFVTAIDDSADWALILGPEPFVIFIEKGGIDPGLPRSDPAYGLGLIRVRPNGAQDAGEADRSGESRCQPSRRPSGGTRTDEN